MRRARSPWIIAAATLLTACGDRDYPIAPVCTAAPSEAAVAGISPALVPVASPYDELFAEAAREFGIPEDLLRAIGYVETGWEMVVGSEEHGLAPAYGVMALRGERLSRGAELAGVSEDAARTLPAANIRAAAALLRSYSEQASPDDADDWLPAVRRFSGIELTEGSVSYGAEVYAVLGGRRTAADSPRLATSTPGCGGGTPPKLTDYDGALWQPSPNYNQRMSGPGGEVHMVIIHSCEGAYTGCWSWLANPASGVSAHYVVREDGAQIRQLVREASRAWHIGATYDSTLNAGHDGQLHGIQSNHFTIGIEHAGYASQSTWPDAQIDASARLVCEATRAWNIPRDSLHIVSHGQLQPYNRTDPGANWPWEEYLAKIDEYCG